MPVQLGCRDFKFMLCKYIWSCFLSRLVTATFSSGEEGKQDLCSANESSFSLKTSLQPPYVYYSVVLLTNRIIFPGKLQNEFRGIDQICDSDKKNGTFDLHGSHTLYQSTFACSLQALEGRKAGREASRENKFWLPFQIPIQLQKAVFCRFYCWWILQ